MILLTPGPCMTSKAVRLAAAAEDLNHRDPDYLRLIEEVKRRLVNVYPTTRDSFRPYLLGGSGTAALEAMISSCIQRGPVLIVESGYYSARVRDIVEVHGIPHQSATFPWTEPWNMDLLDRMLSSSQFEAIICTHNETTIGRLNPIGELAEIAHTHGAKVLVDAMSSFGADDIPFENLDGVCASANKCLHGLPGVSFVLLQKELATKIAGYPRHTYYLSLPLYEGDNPRLTPPVPALVAFREALRELPDTGQSGRQMAYLERRSTVRTGLKRAGLHPLLTEEESSCTLTTAAMPTGMTFATWQSLHRELGFLIYGCKGELAETHFQVANMGELPAGAIDEYVSALPAIAEAGAG